jgi:hypothetical protein
MTGLDGRDGFLAIYYLRCTDIAQFAPQTVHETRAKSRFFLFARQQPHPFSTFFQHALTSPGQRALLCACCIGSRGTALSL